MPVFRVVQDDCDAFDARVMPQGPHQEGVSKPADGRIIFYFFVFAAVPTSPRNVFSTSGFASACGTWQVVH